MIGFEHEGGRTLDAAANLLGDVPDVRCERGNLACAVFSCCDAVSHTHTAIVRRGKRGHGKRMLPLTKHDGLSCSMRKERITAHPCLCQRFGGSV